MPDDILCFGPSSFLAGSVRRAMAGNSRLRFASARPEELARADLFDGVRVVANFAIHPDYYRSDWSAAIDLDLEVAMALDRAVRAGRADPDIRYVLIGSRKVYRPGEGLLDETSPVGPSDAYGANKLATEQRLLAMLGERLTILRVSNVFGYELVPGRRSFLALLLTRLREMGEIRYDLNPFTVKDFIPDDDFGRAVARVLEVPRPGVYNLGSGQPIEIGWIAMWIMEAYGTGRLVVDSPSIKDAFRLDVSRFSSCWGAPSEPNALRAHCLEIGRRLQLA